MIEVKKKEGESPTSTLFRFTQRVRRSGTIMELRGRRFFKRAVNRRKRQASAIYRSTKKAEYARAKKLGN